jgi:hypothetical protein
MRVIWRFFNEQNTGWRWQQVSIQQGVIAESETAYDDYESCMDAAKATGYVHERSQEKLVPSVRPFSR